MAQIMTSRERIHSALRRQPVDRTPFMLWGLDPLQVTPDPSYNPLRKYIAEHGDIKSRPDPKSRLAAFALYIASIMASVISRVPTAVGSSRVGFKS